MPFLLRLGMSEATSADEGNSRAAKKDKASYEGDVPQPTFKKVAYGEHERQILDFWKADSSSPTPLVLVIHGGGWNDGRKERLSRFVHAKTLLSEGISVAAINYRLIPQSQDVVPPVKAPLHDAARALQFIRSKAKKWNINSLRIGAAGGSAGACSSLWLAFHADLAEPESEDLISRQSTRLFCAAVRGAQTSLDPKQMKEWTPNSRYGAHAFGKSSFEDFLNDREEILPWISEYSPYALASKGGSPVFLFYDDCPDMGVEKTDPTHTSNFGLGLKDRCEDLGIECGLFFPGSTDTRWENPTNCLVEMLKK
jgi:acetyl esterase/lipase